MCWFFYRALARRDLRAFRRIPLASTTILRLEEMRVWTAARRSSWPTYPEVEAPSPWLVEAETIDNRK